MPRIKKIISENQARLPLAGHARVRTHAAGIERHVFVGMATLVGLIAAAYVVLIMMSVSHVAAREALARGNEKLAEKVSSLESDYLAHSATITETYATTIGYAPAASRTFIERGTLTVNAR